MRTNVGHVDDHIDGFVTPATIAVAPMNATFGASVTPIGPAQSLDEVPMPSIRHLYKTLGAVLLRGFTVEMGQFDRFAGHFIGETIVNGNGTRENVVPGRQIQTVNGGNDSIPLHAEMAYSPLRPDVVCFYCIQAPAPMTGETLLCDGIDLWNKMPAHLRAMFDRALIRYQFRSSRAIAVQLNGHLSRLAADPRVRTYQAHDDGTADLEFVTPAVQKVRHGDFRAFANSVVVEPESASVEGVGPIDLATRQELFAISVGLSHRIAWHAHDVLVVDNSRIMHGRRRIVMNDGRRIVIKMGWHSDES